MSIKNKAIAVAVSLAMIFTMMPQLAQPAHGLPSTIELDGGSYTLTEDNQLVRDGAAEDVKSIHNNQDIVFHGDTVINLNGYKLICASLKSSFDNPNPDTNEHPWYTYDLAIDGGDKGGSIDIGSSAKDDHTLAANNLIIRNLDKDSSVTSAKDLQNTTAVYAQNDLRVEGIKSKLIVTGENGIQARDGRIMISDVSGELIIDAKRNGIGTDDTSKDNIEIARSTVEIAVEQWMHSCIEPGWKQGITITDSFVFLSHNNDSAPEENSSGGYNALSVYGAVEIKDSFVAAGNMQKDRPAVVVGDPGGLIISGESQMICQNGDGGSVSALMAKDIELKDGNRLFEPKDGSISTTTYNDKTLKTIFNKDGSTARMVGFGSGKELINNITYPSRVFPGQSIRMSGVLRDEDGDPVPNVVISIYCETNLAYETVTTDAQGRWNCEGYQFTFPGVGEAQFTVSVYLDDSEELQIIKYLPSEPSNVKVQVVLESQVESLGGLELVTPPEGAIRKTEYKCGEKFDLAASYVKAKVIAANISGEKTEEYRDLDPSQTIIDPACISYGIDSVKITYLFEGDISSLEYPVSVSHNWDAGKITRAATTTATGVRTFTCRSCKATKTQDIPKLSKRSNPLSIKGKTAKVKYKKLKKKKQTLAVNKVIKFTRKGQGRMTYKITSAKKGKKSYKKYIKINSKTGKVTIKRNSKMKKGTYTVKVKVRAAGNSNYNSVTKTTTFKLKVR